MSVVFFSNLPKEYPQAAIRELFARCGHVVSLRMSSGDKNRKQRPASAPDELTTSGLIEFSDEASANAAIGTYNGFMIDTPRGPTRLRVVASNTNRRRQRIDESNPEGAAAAAASASSGAASIGRFTSDLTAFRTGDPLAAALDEIPAHELAEAVEQLRVLASEAPQRARSLLDTFPQLRRAVCLVLQKNGKLPNPLPPQAFVPDAPVVRQQQQENSGKETDRKKKREDKKSKKRSKSSSGSSSDGDDGDQGKEKQVNTSNAAAATSVEDEEIQNIINELSPDALQQLLSTDFEKQEMEPGVKAHFIRIQKALLALSGSDD